MTRARVFSVVVAGALLALLIAVLARPQAEGASRAPAARAPTLSEREAITLAFSPFVRNAPVECVFMDIRVSSRDRTYALAAPQVLNWRRPGSRCLRYAANGFYLLRKTRGRWRFVYEGSDDPPCSLRIPSDLVGCRR